MRPRLALELPYLLVAGTPAPQVPLSANQVPLPPFPAQYVPPIPLDPTLTFQLYPGQLGVPVPPRHWKLLRHPSNEQAKSYKHEVYDS